MEAHTTEGVDGAARTGATKPGWLPFSVVVGVFLVLCAVPVMLNAITPDRPADSVGFYERVNLTPIMEPTVTETVHSFMGFVAPEGWLKPEPDEADASDSPDRPHAVRYRAADDSTELVVSAHLGVEGADALLHANAPVGAVFARSTPVTLTSGLDAAELTYDLAAGDALVGRTAVCNTAEIRACLLFEASSGAGSTPAADLSEDIQGVLDSAEVY